MAFSALARDLWSHIGTDDCDDVLLDLLRRPAWMADAACKEHPELTWFPERYEGGMAARAKAVCKRCLVAQECLEYAQSAPFSVFGIWAGKSRPERRRHSRTERDEVRQKSADLCADL